MLLAHMSSHVSHRHLFHAVIALDLPFGADASVLLNVRDLVLNSALVFAADLRQSNQSLCELVKHDVNVWTPTGWAGFFVILDLESTQVAKKLAAAVTAKRLDRQFHADCAFIASLL